MKKLNEDLALAALTDFLNAVEAGIEAARQTIRAEKVGLDAVRARTLPLTQKTGEKEYDY